MHYNDTLIIIPAFNEEATISTVIKSIKRECPRMAIVVVNDGSRDATSEKAKNSNVEVIDLPFNLGIGGAVQTGLRYAMENGFKKAVQLDADGQHDPKQISLLLKNLEGFDLTIGSRYLRKTKYPLSPLRKFGNNIFSFLIKMTCGETITDSTSGFRGFGPRAISFFSDHYPADFPEPRSIVTFLKNRYKIREISCEMKKRQGGVSSITPLKAVYLMLSIPIAILFESVKVKEARYE